MNLTDTIRFYNRDCIEAMAEMPDKAFDLAIVDPPFFGGPEKSGYYDGRQAKNGVGVKKYKTIEKWDIPELQYWKELKRVSNNQICWGWNYFPFCNELIGRVIWDKVNDASTFSKAEIAGISLIKSVQVFRYRWHGFLQKNMDDKEEKIHLTQKPVALYKWLLTNYAKPGDKILDTHGGSLSIAIACHDLGFELEAYELDKDYYDAACKRVQQHVAQGQLFKPETFEPKQLRIDE